MLRVYFKCQSLVHWGRLCQDRKLAARGKWELDSDICILGMFFKVFLFMEVNIFPAAVKLQYVVYLHRHKICFISLRPRVSLVPLSGHHKAEKCIFLL